MFQSAVAGPNQSVQYMDSTPTATVYSGGSRSWRNNNPGKIGMDLFAYQHGAIGSAGGCAVFAAYSSGKQALVALLADRSFLGLKVEQAFQRFVPGYTVVAPAASSVGSDDEGETPKRIEPRTGLDADETMRSISGGDRQKMADAIEDLIGYVPGTITKESLEDGSMNKASRTASGGGNNVVINTRTAVHAGSQGTLTSVDVCNTPHGHGCSPQLYPNTAKSSNAAKTASTVFINGHPACHKDSIFAMSGGDEAGTCGGVQSGTIKGKAEFITASNNVFIEGVAAVRQFDLMVSNNRNTPPMPLMQPGASPPPALDSEGSGDGEGMPTGYKAPVHVAGTELHMLKSIIEMDEE